MSLKRRRRRPTYWDVKTPLYGVPLAPPGSTPVSAVHQVTNIRGSSILKSSASTTWDTIIGKGGIDNINIIALRKLLDPHSLCGQTNASGEGQVSIHVLAGMLGGNATSNGTSARQARRLYVGNLPGNVSENDVSEFFNDVMIKSGGSEDGGKAVVSVYLNLDKRFAFIELRTLPETAAALQMDGLLFRGMSLRMRRPNDYDESWGKGIAPPASFDKNKLAIVSTQVGDGPNKVFIGGIPYHFTEDNIKEVLTTYGQLKAFNLIKDPNTGQSKGFAFFEYEDPGVIDSACAGLNGVTIGDKTLTVRRASPGGPGTANGVSASGGLLGNATSKGETDAGGLLQERTKIVMLKNMVSEEDLENEEEMNEIQEDVEGEAKKFGSLRACIIPKKGHEGALKAWLQYDDEEAAEKAVAIFNGRKFAGNTVVATYFDENRFKARDFAD